MLRLAVVTFLALSGMFGLITSYFVAYEDEVTIPVLRPKTQLINFSADEVQNAEIKWFCCYGIVLTRNEIITLVKILSKINKEDITPYTGPAPKGGPIRCKITLNSNEEVGFVTNGAYILVGGGKVYMPLFGDFVAQIRGDRNRIIEDIGD
ncbi:hypothetical protein J2T17_007646 [Paenibacillus mucilaginosus]|uniref:hypothetical protein n=1 Tax=Paenibacillus mucilaginosus TaxID=61624 RepID=UPI003D1948BE